MVNRGRPSSDCAPCRKRKIRVGMPPSSTLLTMLTFVGNAQCDLIPEGCTQCRRVNMICYGYRNPNELVFRDETRRAMQKALASQTANQMPSTPQLRADVSSRHAFLSLYIDRYSYGFQTLEDLLAKSSTNGHLQATVDAVSLAFMAFQLNRPELVPLAYGRYLAAIQCLRTVMGSSQQSSSNSVDLSFSDETLQSVLLLDVYEKMAYRHHHWCEFPNSWLSHVQGALSMVRSRPRADFSNPTTRQLATRTVIALTISCGAAGVSIPTTLAGLHRDLDGYVQNAKWTFIGLLMSVISLRADVRNGLIGPTDALSRARDLEHRIAYAEKGIPPSWRPRRVNACDNSTFDCYYDIYPSHYITQVFNAYRIIRLDIVGMIQSLEPCVSTTQTIVDMTRAICAAVPQFILPEARAGNRLPFSPMQILECSGMLTPLYVAAQITTDLVMWDWILHSLTFMADNGVYLAHEVAQISAHTPEVDYWAVFAMVGSCAITA